MLARLGPNCDRLFHRSRPKYIAEDTVWCTAQALGGGGDTMVSVMKKISEQAGCSKVYTNHSVRATTVTAAHAGGVSDR